MASITIKNIPDVVLDRARALAQADDRSLNKELIHLIEAAVDRRLAETGNDSALLSLARSQAAAWRALASNSGSSQTFEIDGADLMDARTNGREVNF